MHAVSYAKPNMSCVIALLLPYCLIFISWNLLEVLIYIYILCIRVVICKKLHTSSRSLVNMGPPFNSFRHFLNLYLHLFLGDSDLPKIHHLGFERFLIQCVRCANDVSLSCGSMVQYTQCVTSWIWMKLSCMDLPLDGIFSTKVRNNFAGGPMMILGVCTYYIS